MKTTGYNSLKSWGIVATCSVISLSTILFNAAPIYYVAFLDRYGTNRESASLVIIIPGILRYFAGPVAGFFCEILGIRTLTAVGCFLSALGLAICFFAEDIAMVTVSIGLVYGIGTSLAITLLPQAIQQHFQTNITNANGVFRSASCILTFAVIPLVSYLLETYGCSGMLLLTGGIVLQTIPLAMLLRDPKYEQTKNSPRLTPGTNLNLEYRKQNSSVDETNLEKLLPKKDIEDCSKESNVDATNIEKLLPNNQHTEQNNEIGDYGKQSMTKEDRNQIKSVENETISWNNERLNEGKSQLRTPNALDKLQCRSKFRQACLTLTVFKDLSFVAIMVSMSCKGLVGFFVLPILNDYSRDKGIRKDLEQYLIMGYTVFQLVGFSCLGWLVDKGFVKISNYVAANFLCMGLTCCAIRFSNSFVTLFCATGCFAIFYAALSSAVPTLIYEFINKKKQTMAISSALILMAPLSFTIAPLIGYFRGNLGSYDGGLYLMTAVCVGCAALIFMLPHIGKCGKKKNDNSYTNTESP